MLKVFSFDRIESMGWVIATNVWAMICGRFKSILLSTIDKNSEKKKSIRHLQTGHRL
jgi:hypothetical protein